MPVDAWQEFSETRVRIGRDEPMVVIGRGPGMRLSQAAAKMLNDPEAVVFLFDRKAKRIGIRVARPDIRHSFPLRRYGDATMFTVAAEGFYKWAGISYDARTEYPVEQLDDQTIVARLSEGDDEGEFEEFTLKSVALVHQAPNASISRNGNINLNQPAMRLLPPTERVVLLYNEARNLIGLRPAQGERHAKPLRPVKGQNTVTLSAEGFLKRFSIDHEQGKSYEPYLDGEVLVVDLTHPKPPFRARREGNER